jgi:hypothetical protein
LIWGLFFQFCIHGPFDLTKVCKNAYPLSFSQSSQQEFYRHYKIQDEVHRFKKITFQVNFTGSTTNFGFTWNFLWNRSGFCSLYIYNMWVLFVSFKILALNKNLVRYISNKFYTYIISWCMSLMVYLWKLASTPYR